MCSYTTQLLCQYTVSSQYFHNMQHCTNLLLVPLMKEVAHIHIAGIDIVTLAVLMTLQWPQHHTIVIICAEGAHLATHTTEATLYTALTHRDVGKAVLQPVVSPGCYGNGLIFTIIEGLWKTQPPPHLKNGQYECLVTHLILVPESSVVPCVIPFHMAVKHGHWHCT